MPEDVSLAKPPKALADPLMFITRLLVVFAGVNCTVTLAMGNALGAISGVLVCLGFALITAPRRKPNAIYLRAFKTDRSTTGLPKLYVPEQLVFALSVGVAAFEQSVVVS
jgi:hypothetical protein